PILVIDHRLPKEGDTTKTERLWEAARNPGFCLKNHNVEEESNRMFDMGEETMKLPLEEKMKYE
ncbi:hypothetical protein DFS33DRAFT_1254533, partial [Desarmillaria ectypa]